MNSGPTLSIGSTGPDVRRLQILFVMTKEMDYSDIDGTFGPKTQELVKSFQQGSNLTADGIVGPLTWKALPADPNTPRLARGASGSAVSGLQKGLRAFGGVNSATDPGPVDGSFGSRTESAVRAYQSQGRSFGSRPNLGRAVRNDLSAHAIVLQRNRVQPGEELRPLSGQSMGARGMGIGRIPRPFATPPAVPTAQ